MVKGKLTAFMFSEGRYLYGGKIELAAGILKVSRGVALHSSGEDSIGGCGVGDHPMAIRTDALSKRTRRRRDGGRIGLRYIARNSMISGYDRFFRLRL